MARSRRKWRKSGNSDETREHRLRNRSVVHDGGGGASFYHIQAFSRLFSAVPLAVDTCTSYYSCSCGGVDGVAGSRRKWRKSGNS